MYVDVPHLDRLLVAAPITLEGLDHLILKPKQLDGVVAVNVDEVLGHVAMALSKKSQAGKTSRNDLHRQEGLKLGPRLHGIYSGQSGIHQGSDRGRPSGARGDWHPRSALRLVPFAALVEAPRRRGPGR